MLVTGFLSRQIRWTRFGTYLSTRLRNLLEMEMGDLKPLPHKECMIFKCGHAQWCRRGNMVALRDMCSGMVQAHGYSITPRNITCWLRFFTPTRAFCKALILRGTCTRIKHTKLSVHSIDMMTDVSSQLMSSFPRRSSNISH